MDIRQLRYLIAIAEEGSITKAAQALHMAQPPLSKQLQLMEEELGVTLFERNKKRKVTLTPQGELFLKKAKRVVQTMEEAVAEVKEYGEEISGTLSIGLTIYDAPLMMSVLKQFRNEYPQVRFSIWEGNTTFLIDCLDNRQIDIAIAYGHFVKEQYQSRYIDKNECVLIVPKDYKFKADSVDVALISTIPLILFGPVEGNSLYQQIIQEFKQLKLQPNILCECHDSSMLLSLVKSGFGATILPLSMVQTQLTGDFDILKIKNNPWATEPSLIWRTNGYLSAAARRFIDYFEETILNDKPSN
ncbi:transcriptional regulator BsdA [Paenibacillus illinoisensis]|uniref:LysR family transcriptional regulator n=1 Tax=Paenibacillus illinoisensis TaxID=59845 RepID=UPI0034C1FEE8